MGSKHKTKYQKWMKDVHWIARQFSPSTVLWFGKFKGSRIKDIPERYLWWVVSGHKTGEQKEKDGLCVFLCRYLKKQRQPRETTRSRTV